MNGLAFFDTNILLYADDNSNRSKQKRAIELIADHQRREALVISVQVLQEYYTIATRKLNLDPELARNKVQLLVRGRVVRIEPHDVISAIELHRLSQISFWDALIVHAARIAGTSVLYSEDLQDGSKLGGVRIVNPFAKAG